MTVSPGRALIDRLEYVGAWVLFALFGLLPLDAASATGGWLARTVGPRLAITRRAERNMRHALPELDDRQVRAALRGMWDNLGRVVAEYPHLKGFAGGPEGGRIEVVGAEHIERLKTDGKAGIFVSAHVGNWELNAAVAGWHGIRLVQVYRAANNPLVDSLITGTRSLVAGQHIAKGSEGARQIIAAIRRGDHLGMLLDQKMNDGIAVPFFGRDAMTAPAAAQLALRYDIPLCLAHVERLAGARFRVTVEPPLEFSPSDDRDRDVRDIMVRINRAFEGWIRQRPDQWFWLHRRWPD